LNKENTDRSTPLIALQFTAMLDAFTFQEDLEKNTLLCFLFLYKQTMSMGREATWIRVVVRVIMKGPQIFTTHFGIMAVTNLAQLTALN
jgi:hypothetical protein